MFIYINKNSSILFINITLLNNNLILIIIIKIKYSKLILLINIVYIISNTIIINYALQFIKKNFDLKIIILLF